MYTDVSDIVARTAGVVKKIPRWWKYVPFLNSGLATVIYPHIYVPDAVYTDVIEGSPTVESLGILVHEQEHLRRQKIHGPVGWNIRYLTSKKFRLQEELAAIKLQMIFLKQNGKTYDCERKARQFSSSAYLWLTKYKDAEVVLDELWSKV